MRELRYYASSQNMQKNMRSHNRIFPGGLISYYCWLVTVRYGSFPVARLWARNNQPEIEHLASSLSSFEWKLQDLIVCHYNDIFQVQLLVKKILINTLNTHFDLTMPIFTQTHVRQYRNQKCSKVIPGTQQMGGDVKMGLRTKMREGDRRGEARWFLAW